jgi:hypothetical protein
MIQTQIAQPEIQAQIAQQISPQADQIIQKQITEQAVIRPQQSPLVESLLNKQGISPQPVVVHAQTAIQAEPVRVVQEDLGETILQKQISLQPTVQQISPQPVIEQQKDPQVKALRLQQSPQVEALLKQQTIPQPETQPLISIQEQPAVQTKVILLQGQQVAQTQVSPVLQAQQAQPSIIQRVIERKSSLAPEINTGIESVNSISEINIKISELNNTIDAYNRIIKDQVDSIKILREVSIAEDEDYLKKFKVEKKVCLDKVVEILIRRICKKKGFKHLYEAKLIKLILESIFLVNVEKDIKHDLDKQLGNKIVAGTEDYINKITIQALEKHTFAHFRVNCFDAWKFKNFFLVKDDFILDNHIYYMDNNPLPPPEKVGGKEIINQSKEYRTRKYDILFPRVIGSVNDALEVLKDLRKEADKFMTDKYYEKVYSPLLEALQVMLFMKIVKTRLDCHKDNLAKKEKIMQEKNEAIAQFNGKIKLLEDLKDKIGRDTLVKKETIQKQGIYVII